MQIAVYDRPVASNNYIGSLGDLYRDDLQISTKLPGNFYRCTFTIGGPLAFMYKVFTNYLGMRLLVFSDTGAPLWDGMIWSLDMSIGNYSLGPLSMGDIANFVAVEYSDLLNSNNYALTSYVEDADSQNKYGIIEAVLSYGGLTSSAANNLVNRYQANHARPRMSGDPSIPMTGDEAVVTVDCVGWWTTTNFRKFQSTLTTTLSVSARLTEIINQTVVPATPASSTYLQFFDTDTELVREGPDLVIARASLHVETIGSYLARIVSLGDTSYGTWYIGATFGTFNGLFPMGKPKIKTWPRPTTPDFYVDLGTGEVRYSNGGRASPIVITAGKMIKLTDISPSLGGLLNPFDQKTGFVVIETNYDTRTGILSVKPEGGDVDIELVLSRF